MKTVFLRISGRVQGVWYRGWTRETALSLGLNGWVRNRMDGSVEAIISGDEAPVNELIQACWTGPNSARVDDIILTNSDETVKAGFEQKPTI